ncbi:hypothetical protein D1007_18626 [Hordeum vulgare]|nr:hypothetical protein D1007_18626 [Hordeum vulgare]
MLELGLTIKLALISKLLRGLGKDMPSHFFFFYIATDALAVIMNKANEHGLMKGMLGENLYNGVNMLQYVDDSIFLLDDDLDSARNLKMMLCAFEQMSGLKINFHKSE